MLGGSTKIIYIGPDKLMAIEVLDVAGKKFGKSFSVGWTYETLDLALSEIIKKFESKDFRLLISDDLAFVIRFEVPRDPGDIREYVLKELQKKVPDDIEEGEWDFKKIRTQENGSTDIVAFVLVKRFAKTLAGALSKTGLKAEAIEPETISKTRDANAYIGLALKNDLEGRDEDVLNLQPETKKAPEVKVVETPVQPAQIEPPEEPKRRFNFKLLAVLIVPSMLIGALVGGLFYLNKSRELVGPGATPSPSPSTVEATGGALQNIQVEEEKQKVAGLNVQILNGSGVSGEASRVSDALAFEGFDNFETKNASSFDFSDTTVAVKESADGAYSVIERALGEEYSVVKADDYLSNDSSFDVIITVGARK